MKRRAILVVAAIGGALLAAPVLVEHPPALIWNASPSVPVGLYRVHDPDAVSVGDLVAVTPPKSLAAFLAVRGYLPRGVPLIKRVLALPGTTVCRHGATIIADDQAYGETRERDRLGRPLHVWQGCRRIAAGEVFLMNWNAPDSMDSRYFGPLPASTIVARVTPLWTDADGDGRFRWHASASRASAAPH